MRKYTHGGDIYKEKLNIKYDFSANINPLGMPEKSKEALRENIDNFQAYPDPFCRQLTSKLALKEGVDEGFILCGNGAADLVYRLVFSVKPKDVLVLAPTFSEYEEASLKVGAKVHRYLMDEDFNLGEGIVSFIESMENLDMVFLCNPNNPTGLLIHREIILKIAEIMKEKKGFLVVDQCFLPFVQGGENYDVMDYIKEFQNLIILKAFTKIYAMAGLRLGYMVSSNDKLNDNIFSSCQPWSVSTPAQIAGVGALEEEDFEERTRDYVSLQRQKLMVALKAKGFKLMESKANYICFSCEDGEGFRKAMKKEGILIRDCSNYHGLSSNYSRIAVRTEEENFYFINKLEEVKWQRQ